VQVSNLKDDQLAEIATARSALSSRAQPATRSTALANVRLPALCRHQQRAGQAGALISVGWPTDHPPAQRTVGGQQQRVAIARALVSDPAILLAQTTGNLDLAPAKIMHLLLNLNQERAPPDRHHPADVAAQTQRSIHIRDGVVAE
jgi:putative ABC transport system ATP-binding protein